MFHIPQDIATEIYAEVPEKFRKRTATPERIAAGRSAPKAGTNMEGPSFDREGNLYFVDNAHGRIFRADTRGIVDVVAEYDGEPNGLCIHQDGRIFVADYRHGIMNLNPTTGAMTTIVSRYNTGHFVGVNDLVFSKSGDLYFTDQGQSDLNDPSGRVYCLKANGELRCIADNIPSPNGLVLSAKEDVIFVAVTRANAIWKIPLTPAGTVSRMGLFLQLSGGIGPDGIAIDESGGLAIAHPGLGSVWIFSAAGEPLCRVRSCTHDHTTNLAYGGEDRKSLFITESGSGAILIAKVPTAGSVLFSHL